MSTICPTVTAYSEHDYHQQLNYVAAFAERVHIDLMDGQFAPTRSLNISDIVWPANLKVDLHLMYQNPMDYLNQIITLQPSLVIVHNEADVHHMHFAAELHKHGIKAGLALLQATPVHFSQQIMHSFDHVLIFSGNLGHQGGQADMALLTKVSEVKRLWPDVEIGWDGGINDLNARQLIDGGVDVLNAGGFIARAADSREAYQELIRIAA